MKLNTLLIFILGFSVSLTTWAEFKETTCVTPQNKRLVLTWNNWNAERNTAEFINLSVDGQNMNAKLLENIFKTYSGRPDFALVDFPTTGRITHFRLSQLDGLSATRSLIQNGPFVAFDPEQNLICSVKTIENPETKK